MVRAANEPPYTPTSPLPQAARLTRRTALDPQVVGSSSSECDTIPGRQAMASCFFLLRQFDDVLVFLEVRGCVQMHLCVGGLVRRRCVCVSARTRERASVCVCV